MRGPSTSPSSIASRSATSTNARKVPMSRTVVNPAMIVSRAFRMLPKASWAGERITSDAYPWPVSFWPTRCACMSLRPGSTVKPERSITSSCEESAPAGSTDSTRSPLTVMSWSVRTSWAITSMKRPARITVRSSLVMARRIAAAADRMDFGGRLINGREDDRRTRSTERPVAGSARSTSRRYSCPRWATRRCRPPPPRGTDDLRRTGPGPR